MRYLAVLALLIAANSSTLAQEKSKGEAVVDQLLKSTVLIITPLSEPTFNNGTLTLSNFKVGTGVYVGSADGKPVVLTNFHVIRNGFKVRAVFASEVTRLVGSSYHPDRIKEAYQKGRDFNLLSRSITRDLAILEVEGKALKGAAPLALASSSIKPGAEVHTLGCTPSVGLFSYTKGAVRSVGQRELEIFDEKTRRNQRMEMQAIETTNPLNKGDSGGPLVNDKMELVGLAQSKLVSASLVTLFVDRHELVGFLEGNKIKLPGAKVAAKAPAAKLEPAKDEEKAGELKRQVDEGAAINQIVKPIAPLPHGPKTVLTFKTGYIAQHKDQTWVIQYIRAGVIQSEKLSVKNKTGDEMILVDQPLKNFFRISKAGLEHSIDEKAWQLVDDKASWNQ